MFTWVVAIQKLDTRLGFLAAAKAYTYSPPLKN